MRDLSLKVEFSSQCTLPFCNRDATLPSLVKKKTYGDDMPSKATSQQILFWCTRKEDDRNSSAAKITRVTYITNIPRCRTGPETISGPDSSA
jgi:hypothetical protein